MRRYWRLAWRLVWLVFELFTLALRYGLLFLRTAGQPTVHERSRCQHHGARRVLRVFADRVEFRGPLPQHGLLISNHLSYLDIVLLSALIPGVFVSKYEVKSWPVFGWFATLGGTVFVQRERRGHVGEISLQIHELLNHGELVVLFPEGTSSDGRTVLPFKSSLLEPAIGTGQPVFVASLDYHLAGGVVAQDVCYWGDMTFFPHFLKLLGKNFVQARVHFTEIEQPANDRKVLARQLHKAVLKLKTSNLN